MRFTDTGDIPLGLGSADWDSHGVSMQRLLRLFPNLTTEQLISVAGDAFLLMHRRSRRLTAGAPTTSTVATMPGEQVGEVTGETVVVLYPLRRRADSDRSVVCIGRLDGNDVALNDPTVSKYHAFVREEHNGLVIQDAGSKNGTYVDNIRVAAHGAGPAIALRPHCTVRFGRVMTTFVNAATIIEMLPR